MKVPLSWLKEYLPTTLAPEKIAELLTLGGLEVDSITPYLGDQVFEIALTPNLAHCASIRGIARELSAFSMQPLKEPKRPLKEETQDSVFNRAIVTVEEEALCPRYACRVIRNVKVGESPSWLKERLEMCGMRSVNIIVDITNLVMLELGQPLHAFDLDRLKEKSVLVRRARQGEKIVTLDGKEHYPTEETLLICDKAGPIALAGIMGSQETEVTDKTTTVLLESAYFEPSSIRRSAKRLGIHSEASFRFERGCDPNAVLDALNRAATWISELADGNVCKGIIDLKNREFLPKTVSCRLSRVNQLLGAHLAMTEIETLLKRLEFKFRSVEAFYKMIGADVEVIGENDFHVDVPTYRHDIHQEVDVIDEIARLYGFNHIQTQEKAPFRLTDLPHAPVYLFEKEVRQCLLREGLQELLTCDLISPFQASLISPACMPTRSQITLLNPRSIDQSILRASLLPGLLAVVKYNSDHENHSLAGFEVGRIHFQSKETYIEQTAISIVLTGKRSRHFWDDKPGNVDFFDLKGIVENLLEAFGIECYSFNASHFDTFHPGRQATLFKEKAELGILGEVHPALTKWMDHVHPVFFAELHLEELMRHCKKEMKMSPLPQYPASSRDWTVSLTEACPYSYILDLLQKHASPLLESISLLDLYRHEKLGSDRKNMTFRFIYRDPSKTISAGTVENEHSKMMQPVVNRLKQDNYLKEFP